MPALITHRAERVHVRPLAGKLTRIAGLDPQ
jgi:hypothetical protein